MKAETVTNEILLKKYKEVEALAPEEREKYFDSIRDHCKDRHVHKTTNDSIMNFIGRIAPHFRNFEIEVNGQENIPDDTVVFLCNHSNSHDFFTIREIFYKLNKRVTPLGAWDGLNFLSRSMFKLGDVTLIKRNDSKSKKDGILDFCSKILNGKNGLVFGEATWNLHPVKPMMDVKAGIAEIALVTGKAVVPTIFEYVETDDVCKKESELYKKCIVLFGKPITISSDKGLFEQTGYLQNIMETMRKDIWKQEGINKNDLTPEYIRRYVNHTYLKKFKALGFTYDSKWESSYLLRKGNTIENEYYIDAHGQFVPGIIEKKTTYL